MLNERNTLLEDDGIEEEILVEEECSVAQAVWGDIQGNIENQTDLQNALDAKQDSLTEAQLNAVNSGITAEKVTSYDGYADQIASKADQSALNAEATTREQADTALGTRIDNEALARQNADNGLQSQIDAITSQSDVVDVVANYAALQAYDTSSLSDNDVIKVLDDETHEDALTYYRWSTTTQTWSYIGQEAPYYSKGQMDVMLQGKQNTLTAGANIQIQNGTISATDTTYTAGNGLKLNGTEFSADTDVLATKTDLEDYYTKSETDTFLAPKLEAEVLAELPATGEEGKLYLTPKAHTTQTATGNPITATVAEDAGTIESFQLDGDTFQQSYEGKNLANPTPKSSGSSGLNGLTASYNEVTGEITISGTATNTWSNPFNQAGLPLKAGTYTLSQTGELTHGVLGIAVAGRTYAVDASTKKVTFSLDSDIANNYIWIAALQNGDVVSGTITAQLEAGNDATAFEKFVGGQPSPSPEYPQTVQTVTGEQTVTVAGENLLSSTWEDGGLDGATGEETPYSNSVRTADFVKVEPSETYILSRGGAGVAMNVFRYGSDKSFLYSSTISAGNVFTTSAQTQYVKLFRSSTGGTEQMQLQKGSTITPYTPYSKQTLPLNLGKNLFDNTGWEQGQYSDGVWAGGNTKRATSGFIPITGGTYTMSLNSTDNRTALINLNYFDSAKTWLGNRATLGLELFGYADRVKTFTLPNNASYLRVTVRPYGGDDQGDNVIQYAPSENLQVEAGSQATTYAPYFTPIELCKLGTYQDYIWKDGGDWKVHKICKTITLDGSEYWQYSSNYSFFYAELITGMEIPVNAGVACYCRTHKGLTSSNSGPGFATEASGYSYAADVHTTQALARIKDTRFSSTQDFANWLTQNNTTIYYVVKSATDTTITDTALIAQLEAIRTASLENGANTITNTAAGSNLAGDMEIGYYGYNPRNRYDKWLWLDINNEYEQIGS